MFNQTVVITPTADQPTGMVLAERYMSRQTLQPDRWIVADDGDRPATLTMGQEHLVKPRTADGGASLAGNVLAALDALPVGWCGMLVIWEHDDWYAPDHIEVCKRMLHGYQAAGSIWQRYYHVPRNVYRTMHNIGSALCNTALHSSVIDKLRRSAEKSARTGAKGVDRQFWDSLDDAGKNLHTINTVVGIKGLPGREGIGMGHQPRGSGWKKDPDGEMLRLWVGDDANAYLGLIDG